jgi:dihydropyrimidinase
MLLIRNADIITADSRFRGDIYAEGDTITRIGDLSTTGHGIIDATGKLVFPSSDPHVPLSAVHGHLHKDTTRPRASRRSSAAPRPARDVPRRFDDALEGYQLWKSKAEGSARATTFHMSVTRFDDRTEGQLREIVTDGIASFKIFLACKNFFGVDDGESTRPSNSPSGWA